MASTYTLNNGIELIGTGEQSGTWGDTTNTNLSLLDAALDGQVTVTLATAGTSGSPNALPISDGSASDGRNRMIIFADGGDLGATAYVQLTPNDAEKIIYIRNDLSGSRSILFFQGTYNASNDYEVPAGTTAVIYFDGGGTGAVAANVFNNAYFDSLRLGSVSVTAIIDDDTMATASATNIATSESIKAYVDTQVGANNELSEVLANGNTSGGNAIQMTTTDELQFRDTALKISSSADGQLDIDADTEIEIVAPTVDIDASTAMTIDTAALTVTGAVDLNTSLNVDGTVTSDGLTVDGNLSVDNGSVKLDGNYPEGTANVALGNQAGDALTTGGNHNTALGNNTLSATTTGDYNLAAGSLALNVSTGQANTALGYESLYLNVTGSSNTAVGSDTLQNLVSGSQNTVIGRTAGGVLGQVQTAGSFVTDVNYTIQTTGTTDFTLIGAADSNPGTTFTATGAGTGTGTASANADYNTFVGHQAGDVVVGGSKNTILGRFDGNQNTIDIRNSDNNIVLSDGDGNPRLAYVSANTELVINEQSADVDFRVESNTNTHALFVDASTDRVGIKTTSPGYPLTVSGVNASTSAIGIVNTTNSHDWYFGASTTPDALILADVGSSTTPMSVYYGAPTNSFLLKNGVTIFNENGLDQDLRVESNNNQFMFFIDGGDDAIGINTSSTFTTAQTVAVGNTKAEFNATQWASFSGAQDGSGMLAQNLYRWHDGSTTRTSYVNTHGTIGGAGVIVGAGWNTGKLVATNTTGTAGAEATALQTQLTWQQGGVTVNDDGANIDFRVGSNTNTHALFVDASTDRVGIGTATTNVELTVDGSISNAGTYDGAYYYSPYELPSTSVASNSPRYIILARINSSGRFINGTIYGARATASSATRTQRYDVAVSVNSSGTIQQANVTQYGYPPSDVVEMRTFTYDGADYVGLYIGTSGSSAYPTGYYFEGIASSIGEVIAVDDSLPTSASAYGGTVGYTGLRNQSLIVYDKSTTLNENGDSGGDFRVESGSNANMLFVDAGNDRVGILNSSPDFALDVGPTNAAGGDGIQINATRNATLRFLGNDTSMQANEITGRIEWYTSDTNAPGIHAQILTRATNTNASGEMQVWTGTAGSINKNVHFRGDQAVFNEDSNDMDFRVEGGTRSQLFLIDAGEDQVFVGNNTEGGSNVRFNVNSDDSGTIPMSVYRNYNANSGALFMAQSNYNGGSQTTNFQVKTDGDCENTNNNYGAISDERVKQQIADASDQWDDIKAIQIRKYKLNGLVEYDGDENTPFHLGVIAQELEAAGLGGLVKTDDETGMKSVKYTILYMKAVKALQEAITKIEDLETRIAALENA